MPLCQAGRPWSLNPVIILFNPLFVPLCRSSLFTYSRQEWSYFSHPPGDDPFFRSSLLVYNGEHCAL